MQNLCKINTYRTSLVDGWSLPNLPSSTTVWHWKFNGAAWTSMKSSTSTPHTWLTRNSAMVRPKCSTCLKHLLCPRFLGCWRTMKDNSADHSNITPWFTEPLSRNTNASSKTWLLRFPDPTLGTKTRLKPCLPNPPDSPYTSWTSMYIRNRAIVYNASEARAAKSSSYFTFNPILSVSKSRNEPLNEILAEDMRIPGMRHQILRYAWTHMNTHMKITEQNTPHMNT